MVSEKYGKDRRSKYKRFIKDLIGEKDFSDIYLGMFENILFDGDSNIIFKSNDSDDDAEMRFAGFKVFASKIFKIDAVVRQQSLPLFNSLIQLLGIACRR